MTKALGYIKSNTFKERISFLFNDLWGKDKELLPHVHPLSLLTLFEKFRIFRTRFHLHFYASLFFHIINVFLIYWVSLKLSSDQVASITGAVMFGACALIADTVFLPGFLVYLLTTTLLLLTIGLHPVFNHDQGILSFSLFLIANALSPWLMELGLVTVFISLCFFVIYDPMNIFFVSFLCIFILIPLFVRFFLSRRIRNSCFCFIGFSNLLKNIIIGNLKLFMGLLGGVFKMKATDTLYVLKPDFRHLFTWLSIALTVIISYYLVYYMFDMQTLFSKKIEIAICFFSASLPFLMVSLAYNMPNPNKDLSHQMPRYFYFPAALICIVCVLLSPDFLNKDTALLVILFLIISGVYGLKNQILLLKSLTDKIRERLELFNNTGLILINPECSSLDWSFDIESVRAYLEIEDPNKADFVRNKVKELTLMGERNCEKGELDKAKALFANVAKYSDYAPAFNNLGVIEFLSGNYDYALIYFTKAFNLDKNNRDIVFNLVKSAVKSNNIQIGKNALSDYISNNPNETDMIDILRHLNSIAGK